MNEYKHVHVYNVGLFKELIKLPKAIFIEK